MTQNMTPSEMTAGQIVKATSNFRAMLEKHAPEFDPNAVQTVLGQSEFVDDCFANFRKRVEVVSNLIVRKVRVNRSRSQQEVLEATGCKQYTDRRVVDSMPKGEGDEVEVVFFKLDLSERDGWINDDDLEEEFELHGFKSADPYSVAAVNEADSAFVDKHPNCTHWKDINGKWCYIAFNRWFDERYVDVNRRSDDWNVSWWFAGLRK